MSDENKKRIVITGLGIITSLGSNMETNYNKLVANESGIKPISVFNTEPFKSELYSHINDIDIDAGFTGKENDRLERCYKLLEIAAKEAAFDAKLPIGSEILQNIGLYLGSIIAGDPINHKRHAALLMGRRRYRHCAYLSSKHIFADLLSRRLQITGPRMLISTACTASSLAIAVAAESIRSGQIDLAFAGGSDPVSEFIFAGFHSMRNISSEPCAPFSVPEGMTLGEGAAFLVLERLDKALSRGAKIYAELLGYAMTADAKHPTSPDVTGESHRNLIEKAIEHSCIDKTDIDYINLHGTGTKTNDKTEILGLRLTFGDELDNIKVSSIKGAVGHTLGGAGVVEAAVTVMSIYKQQLIPNVGFKGFREDCESNIVELSERSKIDIAMTNNYAFGGNNSSLIFAKYKKFRETALRESNRVVITGIGMVSPFGTANEELLAGITKKINLITFCQDIPYFSIDDTNLEQIFSYDARRADRLGKIILASTQLAFNDAHFDSNNLDTIGIVSGTSHAHIASSLAFNEMVAQGQPQFANPIDFANAVANSGCGLASINLNATGCNIAICTGQMSGLQSIALSYELIKNGREKAIICGGADNLDKFILDSLAAIFKTPSSKDSALVNTILRGESEKSLFGEGGCYFVLEKLESAIQRKAHIYCEINGHSTYGGVNSNKLLGEVEQDFEIAMMQALHTSRRHAEEIDLIVEADLLMKRQRQGEKKAIIKIFGDKIMRQSFIPYFGVSAAMGPLSLASTILSKKTDKVVSKSTMVNSMSFGGAISSLIITSVN